MRGRVCNAWQRMVLLVLVCIAITAGCERIERQSERSAVPEIRPGILAGYLKQEALPNSLELVPPPPAAGSAALALDEEVSRKSLALRGTPRWELATEDANLMFPQAAGTFSCALGAPITEQDTPHLYMLIRRTLADAGLSTYMAKNHYQRIRPFMVNEEPTCTPDEEAHLVKDGSYPSGHTAVGWAWALILSEIDPERADAILSRGRAGLQPLPGCMRSPGSARILRLPGPKLQPFAPKATNPPATARPRQRHWPAIRSPSMAKPTSYNRGKATIL